MQNKKSGNIFATVLDSKKNWVLWNLEEKDGHPTKIPYSLKGSKASSTNPATWSDYESAKRALEFFGSGIGIMFPLSKKLLGIDIDHVLENGVIEHERKEEIERLIARANTYTEVSPSGTGLHLYLSLTEPLELVSNKKAPFEAYTSGRFFTVTEVPYGSVKPVRVVTVEEAEIILGIIGYPWVKGIATDAGKVESQLPKVLEDNELLEKMFGASNGDTVKELYDGDTSTYDLDESRADMALCSYLAFWTGRDSAQMERIWLSSALGSREKTRSRKDYRDRTINTAIDSCKEIYNPLNPTIGYEKPIEPIDTSKFVELTPTELLKILGLTIKHDEQNKLIAFLCQLSAYTDNAPYNVSFNAPSSTGKSYIPTEIAKLFPKEDVMEIGYCSPTAFFHEVGVYDKEKNTYTIDLSRKIIIFVDMPHNDLLARLRPLLSHDKKIIESKITDKNQKGGMRTKTVRIKGFPAVTFCTAGLTIDEQEATRFFLLSPEISQEKIREGIQSIIRKEADSGGFKSWLDSDPERALLKERIRGIKQEGITEINVGNPERIEQLLLGKDRKLKPRNQRDAKRLMSLVKALALLNVWFRERNGTVITANEHDVIAAIELWEKVSVSQELNLPPYVFDLYNDVVVQAWKDKNGGLEAEFNGRVGMSRQELLDKHYAVYGRPLNPTTFRVNILPMLETAGLITQERSTTDARLWIVYPVIVDSVVDALSHKENSAKDPGVEEEEFEDPFEGNRRDS